MIERQDRGVVLLRKILRELKELKEMLADERRNFSK
jgi:hypothetical protein